MVNKLDRIQVISGLLHIKHLLVTVLKLIAIGVMRLNMEDLLRIIQTCLSILFIQCIHTIQIMVQLLVIIITIKGQIMDIFRTNKSKITSLKS